MRNYIDEKYIIITNKANVTKIKDICSHARAIHLEPGAIRVSDFMGINKFLIDVKAVSEEFINEMKSNPVNKIVELSSPLFQATSLNSYRNVENFEVKTLKHRI